MPTRRFCGRGPLALFGLLLLLGTTAAAKNEEAIEARMRQDITFLASDECEGRGIETAGIQKAAAYIVAEFAKAGLKPGGPDGGYFQPFTVQGQPRLEGQSTLTLKGPLGQEIELRLDTDFQVMGTSGGGRVTAPLVFVGYGATAPDIGYDDYKGVDVAGKIVVALRHTPRWNNKDMPFDGDNKEKHAALTKKQGLAESNRAAALVLVNDRTEAPAGDRLMSFGYVAGASSGAIPAVHLRRAVMDMVFESCLGTQLEGVEKTIDRDLKPRGTPLAGWTATVATGVTRSSIACRNIIGVVEGSGPLANETVVIGAHYDHLGYGGSGSRAKEPNKKQIHHGADDNGSGTTSVLELARRFGQMKNRQGRRLVFMTFSAEEMGLLGSQHYCNKDPLFPLADTVTMVNLDMVGRLSLDKETKKGKLIVEGVGTAKTFDAIIDKLNPGFLLTKKQGGTGPSDHDSFYRKKVPVVFFWTGNHVDYHRPSDTSDKINVAGMRQIVDLTEKVIAELANDAPRPEYVQVANSFTPGTGKSGPKLGIMPNYDEDKEGVLIGGVSDGGPAAQGGVKAGDLIVELGGKTVTNINTYMVIMSQQQSGQVLEVGVVRDGKKLALKVVPR
jgi:hypothetical protein